MNNKNEMHGDYVPTVYNGPSWSGRYYCTILRYEDGCESVLIDGNGASYETEARPSVGINDVVWSWYIRSRAL